MRSASILHILNPLTMKNVVINHLLPRCSFHRTWIFKNLVAPYLSNLKMNNNEGKKCRGLVSIVGFESFGGDALTRISFYIWNWIFWWRCPGALPPINLSCTQQFYFPKRCLLSVMLHIVRERLTDKPSCTPLYLPVHCGKEPKYCFKANPSGELWILARDQETWSFFKNFSRVRIGYRWLLSARPMFARLHHWADPFIDIFYLNY